MSAAARRISGNVVHLRAVAGSRDHHDHADAVETLRDVADELELDPDVRGVVIIVDRETKPILRYYCGGRLGRCREKLAVALHRIAHVVTHPRGE